MVARLALSEPRRSADRVFEPPDLRRPAHHLSRPWAYKVSPPRASAARPRRRNARAERPREVQRVVDLVLEHIRRRPTESLGVITMGIKHAHRIEMALDRERQNVPELEEFFAADKRNRFL